MKIEITNHNKYNKSETTTDYVKVIGIINL